MFGKNDCIFLAIQIAPNASLSLPSVFVCLLKKWFLWTFDLCNTPQDSDIYKSNENLHISLMMWKRMAGLTGDQRNLLLPSEHTGANICSSLSEFSLKHISTIGHVSGCFKTSSPFWAKALTFCIWDTDSPRYTYVAKIYIFLGNFRIFFSPDVHLDFLFLFFLFSLLFCFRGGDEFIHCNSILMQWHKSSANRKQKQQTASYTFSAAH